MHRIFQKSFYSISFKKNLNLYTTHPANWITTAPAAVNYTDEITEPKWQLVASACVTRTPIVPPDMTEIEKEYNEYLKKKEIEESVKSDHELRLIEDKVRIDLLNLGDRDTIDFEEASRQTGAEFEDISIKKLQQFQFAPKTTDSDKNNDLTSLNRALDRNLVLTVKMKLGSQEHWVLPQTPWIPGESLRQSCERLIKSVCGAKVKVKILGNSPCGFFKYKYPKEVRKEGFIGAKIFFFPGYVTAYDSQGLDLNSNVLSYRWLTHEDLGLNLSKSYHQAVSQFLIPDT